MGDSGEPVTIFEGMKPKITFESRNVRVQKSFQVIFETGRGDQKQIENFIKN